MFDILLFAGTSEGHRIADHLRHTSFRSLVLTATEYGKQILEEAAGPPLKNGSADIHPGESDSTSQWTKVRISGSYNNKTHPPAAPKAQALMEIRSGRLDQRAIETLLRTEATATATVIDATHPYAAAASENIRSACEVCGRRYIRVLRKGSSAEKDYNLSECSEQADGDPKSNCDRSAADPSTGCGRRSDSSFPLRLTFPDIPSAAAYLNQTEGAVFVTTGSKELEAYTSMKDYRSRLFVRVLSLPSVVQKCSALGFEGKHLICMQGPFSTDLNTAMIRHCDASYLVTKDTGIEGGFPEKEEAAAICGCTLIVISRPVSEEGISVEACIENYLRQ
uniref:precorrin-6A/cobalt-precorrin-6A reductase n=1 Tax=Eubacterium cellulosolvens TaxID=29322 RepID=UPI000687A534|nr:precorrin-6A/cobalt-precorrin-6A reductase [[Eubacterium] cellulosolvens]